MLYIFFGTSASGKTAIADRLFDDQFRGCTRPVSATTRAIREGEIDGKSYHFMSEEQFLDSLDKGLFIESAVYNSKYYGTLISEFNPETNSILVREIAGCLEFKKRFPDQVVLIYIERPRTVVEQELRNRKVDPEETRERLMALDMEMENKKYADIILINDGTIEEAVEKVKLAICRLDTQKNS